MSIPNLWPKEIDKLPIVSPAKILETQAELLNKLTSGFVYAEVSRIHQPLTTESGLFGDFKYRFNIIAPFLDNYKYRLFSFSHSITIFPVYFILDGSLYKEFDIKQNTIEIKDSEALENFIGRILQSNRTKSIIGSILAMSK